MKRERSPQEARTKPQELAQAVYWLNDQADRATPSGAPPAVRTAPSTPNAPNIVRTTAYGWRGASRAVHGDAWPEAVRVRPTYEHPPSGFLTALAGLFWFAALIGGAAFAWIAWG